MRAIKDHKICPTLGIEWIEYQKFAILRLYSPESTEKNIIIRGSGYIHIINRTAELKAFVMVKGHDGITDKELDAVISYLQIRMLHTMMRRQRKDGSVKITTWRNGKRHVTYEEITE